MVTRHVIVGAGPAGQNAVETIRAVDPDAKIDLVCGEPAYARMVLPYFVAGDVEERALRTGDADYYAKLGVETHFGVRVEGVDPAAGSARLSDGIVLEFDRLLAATGSRAAEPSIPGLAGDGVGAMWTLEDAKGYLAGARKRTAVIGAGFIAFTTLDALVARSESVAVVEQDEQILPRMLDSAAAGLVADHLRDRGIEIHTGARVESAGGEPGARRLALSGGSEVECDAVILATGVQPNVEWLAGSGVEIGAGPGAGVLVDAHLQSSAASVYAAGDVAEGPDLLTGDRRVHAIQPTAVDHGRVAGAHMAGLDVAYAGSLTMNILSVQGIEACSFGDWQGTGRESTVVSNAGNRIYRKYVWDGDRIVGGALVGPTAAVSGINDVGMLKGLIQTGVGVGEWRGYLEENPLDLRRVYIASGAPSKLAESSLLTGRASLGGGYRFPSLPALRKRGPHHATLLSGKS